MSPHEISRRSALKAGLAASAVTSLAGMLHADEPVARKKRIHQSVCRWCYKNIPLDDLCAASAQMGLMGIDLLGPEDWDTPRKHGLICTMGQCGGGTIP